MKREVSTNSWAVTPIEHFSNCTSRLCNHIHWGSTFRKVDTIVKANDKLSKDLGGLRVWCWVITIYRHHFKCRSLNWTHLQILRDMVAALNYSLPVKQVKDICRLYNVNTKWIYVTWLNNFVLVLHVQLIHMGWIPHKISPCLDVWLKKTRMHKRMCHACHCGLNHLPSKTAIGTVQIPFWHHAPSLEIQRPSPTRHHLYTTPINVHSW